MARLLLKDLTPGTIYKVQVRSKEGDSTSEWSRLFTIDTEVDTTPPDVPVWATTNDWVVNGDTFVATWQPLDFNLDQNKDFSHYELRVTDGTTAYTIRTNNTSYTLTFEQNRIYWTSPKASLSAQVRSVDQVGNVSAFTTLKTVANPVPPAPGSISVTALYDSVKIDWAAVTVDDLKNYKVQVSTTSASTGFTDIYNGLDTSFVHSTLAFATDHWYRVYALDKFGTISSATTSGAVRPKSTFALDTNGPGNPTSVTTTQGFDLVKQQSYANIAWTAPNDTDLNAFEIRYSTTTSNWQYITVNRDTTSVRINDLLPNTSYYIAVRAVDFSGNGSNWVNDPGANKYPILLDRDTTAPATPATPTAAVGTQRLQVTINGLKSDGQPMDADVAYYEVFASTLSGFTTYDSTTMLGTVQAGPAMVETFQIPASSAVTNATSQSWYVRVRAVDRSGNVGPISAQSAAAAVGLILTANIGDAQITNAKIATIEAQKITAGTGFINDLTVKSKFTLGDASSTGVIESYDYTASGGTTGFRLSNAGLIIKTGSIEAAALNIQRSPNMMPLKYADFEEAAANYNTMLLLGTQTITVVNDSKFNTQAVKMTWTAPGYPTPAVFLSNGAGDYNIPVVAGQQYVLSGYVWNSGTVAHNVGIGIYWADAAGTFISASSAAALAAFGENGTAAPETAADSARVSGVVTAPAGATKGVVFLASDNPASGAGYTFDGIQLEPKRAGTNEPTAWSRPGSTVIDGGMIRTGEIRSSGTLTINGVTIPTWSIKDDGDALFGNLVIRGNTTVGYLGSEDSGLSTTSQAGSSIRSANYSAGTSGWAIFSNGLAEFRNLVVGSLPGGALQEGTVPAGAIESGSVLAANVRVTGSLHATGDMGEDIGLTGEGFMVLGPHQVGITSAEIDGSQVATLTTNIPHGFAVGKKLVVTDLGAPYDGKTWVTAAGTAGTTIKYAISGAPLTALTTGLGGIAKSLSTDSTVIEAQPRLIEFPTDGANPNIISGELKAENLTVLRGGSFMGPVSIDNTNLIISSGVSAPRLGPQVTNSYVTVPFSGKTILNTYSMTIGHNGNFFILGKDSANILIEEFSAATGERVNVTTISPITTRTTGTLMFTNSPRGFHYDIGTNRYYYSYTQVKSGVAGRPVPGVEYPDWRYEYVETLNTSFASVYLFKVLEDEGNDAGYRGTTIGWDFVGNRLMHLNTSYTGATVRYLTTNSTTGEITAVASTLTLNNVSGGSSATALYDPRYLVRINNGEFGAERIIVKDVRTTGATGSAANYIHRYTPFNTSTGNPVDAEQWPAPTGNVYGASYNVADGHFYQMTANGFIKFEKGESWWTNNTSMTVGRYVGYSFYDSVPAAVPALHATFTITSKQKASGVARLTTSVAHGMSNGTDMGRYVEITGVDANFNGWAKITNIPTGDTFEYTKAGTDVAVTGATGTMSYRVHETTISPITTHALQKRARMTVTITNIPKFTGDYPNKARVYMSTSLAGTYFLRSTIDHPGVSGPIVPQATLPVSGTVPIPENGFAFINIPSRITTTDGTSYWDGSGTAKFNSLILPSSAKVMNGMNFGSFSGTTDAAGKITGIVHGLGAAPTTVLITGGGNGSTAGKVYVTGITATTFDAGFVNSTNGAVLASASVNGYWIALR